MQTPKARNNSSEVPSKLSPRPISREGEVPQKISPRGIPSEVPQKVSPRVVRQLKTPARDSDYSVASSNSANRNKDRSPKITERRSPRSPVPEKKRPSRFAELESQISQLQDDLKNIKDQLCSSEAAKKQAQKDAEESQQQLVALSLKLEESQKLLSEKSSSEKVPVSEVSEEQNSTLQLGIEVVEEQNSVEKADLSLALNEIKVLKLQLEMVAESEATQTKHSALAQSELHSLKENLSETLSLVEDMKHQLKDCKKSEAHAQSLVGETLQQLETARKTVENLRSDGSKAMEAYETIASELNQSRARVNFLEELVTKLKAEIKKVESNEGDRKTESEVGESLETELASVKLEVQQLRLALEAAEIRYNEEQNRSKEQVRNAHELVEQIKLASSQRKAELELELKKSKAEIEELKANLMDKETELQGICEENEGLALKLENSLSGQRENELEKDLQKSKEDVEYLKATLTDKEAHVQNVLEENVTLKLEIKRKEINNNGTSDEVSSELEAARSAEREALMKVGFMTEELDKSNRKAVRVTEQLDAAQAANAELEAELRRLKVQSDQWRKAAEAAAAMLSAGNNGKLMERTGSMDSSYSPRRGKISSLYGDDVEDDDLLKKKNANMLKKLGVLWKKPQK